MTRRNPESPHAKRHDPVADVVRAAAFSAAYARLAIHDTEPPNEVLVVIAEELERALSALGLRIRLASGPRVLDLTVEIFRLRTDRRKNDLSHRLLNTGNPPDTIR